MLVTRKNDLNNRFNRFNLNLVDSGLIEADSQWSYDNVCSPFNRLYFIEAGEAYFFDDHRTILLRPGWIYLIPAGKIYHYRCPLYMKKVFFHFNIMTSNGMDLFEGGEPYVELAVEGDELAKVGRLIQSKTLSEAFLLKHLLYSVLARVIDSTRVEDKALYQYSELLGRLFAMTTQNMSAQTRICDMAKQLSVSPNTLSKKFKQEIGIPIRIYLDRLLMQKARQLLLTTPQSIRQIADELRFCDQYYFSRFFKRHQNETPTQYRKKMHNMN